MKTLTVKEVKGMTVAQLRKVAPQYGVKNASKHKRNELEQMLIDAVEAKNAKAVKERKNSKTVAKTSRVKAQKVSDEQVQAIADVLAQKAVKREVNSNELMLVNRKVLIRVMKALHCKRWYRTYDKPTMVQLILGATA